MPSDSDVQPASLLSASAPPHRSRSEADLTQLDDETVRAPEVVDPTVLLISPDMHSIRPLRKAKSALELLPDASVFPGPGVYHLFVEGAAFKALDSNRLTVRIVAR